MSTQSVDSLIERAGLRWDDCEGLEEATLIRLAILRDLLRDLHGERSKCLADGKKDLAQSFRGSEKQVEDLRTASPLAGKLNDTLANSAKAKRRTRLLPEALFGFIPRDKLERFDRTWEATLAAEAASLGWCFWSLDAWIDIREAERFQEDLASHLNPHGVILFAESAQEQAPSQTALDQPAGPVLWHGRWYVVLKPMYLTPEFHIERLAGVSKNPGVPSWRLLFSPKRR